MPLLGMAVADVLAVVRSTLAEDEHALAVSAQLPLRGECDLEEHVPILIELSAASLRTARGIASDLHYKALQAVLASVPTDSSDKGWTSGFQNPELALD